MDFKLCVSWKRWARGRFVGVLKASLLHNVAGKSNVNYFNGVVSFPSSQNSFSVYIVNKNVFRKYA